jgi:hypothetical protein
MPIDFDTIVHPDYQRMDLRWKMAHAFWLGGINVLAPSYKPTMITYAVADDTDSTGGTDSEIDWKVSKYHWHNGWYESFLWKHETEKLEQYAERARRQIHLPLFQYVINVFSAGILRQPINREGATGAVWESYHSDIDMAGTDINAFVRQAMAMALVFGRVHAVTDRFAPQQESQNRQQQIDQGERAYSMIVSPLDILDWELDQYGRFVWARIREPDLLPRRYDEEATQVVHQHRIWSRDRWILVRRKESMDGNGRKVGWEQGAQGWKVAEEGTHSLGEVPIATLYATKDGRPANMGIESPMATILDIDRDVLNKLSQLDQLEIDQAFSTLVYPEADGMAGPPMDLGSGRWLGYPQGASAPGYISPNPSIADGLWNRIQAKIAAARQLAGVSRGRAEYSKEERSGLSLTLESEDKRNQLAWWAAALEEFDTQLHRHVARWEGLDDAPRAIVPRNFDVKGMNAELSELLQLKSTDVVGRFGLAAMVKPVVEQKLRENGRDDTEIAAVMEAIDEEAAKEPEPDPPPFGQPEQEAA